MSGIAGSIGSSTRGLPRVPSHMLWLPPVIGSLFAAYLWKYRIGPEVWPSYGGTYVVAPLFWGLAALIAYAAWRNASPGPHERSITGLALVVGLFSVAVTVLVGIYAGTGVSPYGHTPRWLVTNIAFAGAPLVAIECARAYALRAFGRHAALTIAVTAILATLFAFSYRQFASPGSADSNAQFYGARVMPELSSNILAGFLAFVGGPLASIAYRGALLLYEWYSPYLADPPWVTTAFVGVATPAVALWVVESLAPAEDVDTGERVAPSGRFAPPSTSWVITAIASLGLLWFSMGFFGVKPSFIPSHSMEPQVGAGSLVITRDVDPDAVGVGDIVLYRRGRDHVLHRIIARWPNGTFTTKGDNNNTPDPDAVFPQQIEGRLILDIPHLGWVPIWVARGLNGVLGR